MKTSHPVILAAVLSCFVAAPLVGQDQFGENVAITGGEILVMKGSGVAGSAAVCVLDRDEDGRWEVQRRLRPAVADLTGEELGPGMAIGPEILLVGSGDSDGVWAAHRFGRTDGGDWVEGDAIPLDPRMVPVSGPRTVDLPAGKPIPDPPRRVVAYDRGRVAAAVVGRDVRILDRRGDTWMVMAVMRSGEDGGGDGFGAALALDRDRIAVGAPLFGESGGVFVYSLDDVGEWSLETVLAAAGLDPSAGFGSAVALAGDEILVGAPGAGVVIHYVSGTRREVWNEMERIVPHAADSERFGHALALEDDDLWVGAPETAGGGGIHRFQRAGRNSEWAEKPPIEIHGLESGFMLGSSIAVDGDVVVAGAPGADDMRGRVVVFARDPTGNWAQSGWVAPGE